MERRTLLTTIGIGAATAAAGCLSSASSDGPGNDTDDDGDPGSGDGDSQPGRTHVAGGETERRSLGSGALDGDGRRRPHTVALANRTTDAVEATFAIRGDGSSTFEERFELEADASTAVALTELARYEVEASIPDADASTTETLGLDRFGCNGGRTTIRLSPDGTLESGTISTMMACPGVVTERVAAGESLEHTIGGGIAGSGSAGGGSDGDGSTGSDDGAASEPKHSLGLENPTGETWTVRAVLSASAGPLFDGVFSLEADASVNLPIAESGDYELEASVLETDADASESVGAEYFDCNVSSTNATVDADGELAIRTISTMIACDVEGGDGTATNGSG